MKTHDVCNNCGKKLWFWQSGLCGACTKKEADHIKGKQKHDFKKKNPRMGKHFK